MKKILLFILSILTIVTIVLAIFGVIQARSTKEQFIEDLETTAKTVAESVELSAQYALAENDLRSLKILVQKFQKRKDLQGCIVYDNKGNILAITERFSFWKQKDAPYIQKILTTQKPRGALEKFQKHSVYAYALPVINNKNQTLGVVEVIYDTSYMFNMLAVLWERISLTLIALMVLITTISFLVQRRFYILPIQNLTKWFHRFQKGETNTLNLAKDTDELGQLASEVEQVALSLRVARNAVSEKAQIRIEAEETWTETKLKDLIQAKLSDNAFFVVSNREPFMHVTCPETQKPQVFRPASGVVSAIDPILRALGGMWVAHGSGDLDKKFVNSKNKLGVPPGNEHYILKRVWLTKKEEAGYYYGFANEGLWPLCHITHTRPVFREKDWKMYKKVNQKFADEILEELPAKEPFIWIQDYHFTLLAKMIKEKRPDATIALFWHIPWPTPEAFDICPYQQEILNGMLGCDLIGFHVQNHCNNFLDTVNRLTECRVDMEKFSIVRDDKETLVKAFPISIDTKAPTPKTEEINEINDKLKLKDKIVAVGVDRIDYTKGITERLLAIDRFLEKYPQYKNKFVFIQLAAPSRTHIARYQELTEEIDGLTNKINKKYSNNTWKPIIYLKKHFSSEEVYSYYNLANICIVSSLHDGMNLVAKEYVSAKSDQDGVLILSRFTGAARELNDALQINPYSIEEFADTIKEAVEMPPDERKQRITNMQQIINENNIYKWAGSIISELTSLKK
jgi:alpha,alpha-trehalose-phosphate synthase [UDP-forming]